MSLYHFCSCSVSFLTIPLNMRLPTLRACCQHAVLSTTHRQARSITTTADSSPRAWRSFIYLSSVFQPSTGGGGPAVVEETWSYYCCCCCCWETPPVEQTPSCVCLRATEGGWGHDAAERRRSGSKWPETSVSGTVTTGRSRPHQQAAGPVTLHMCSVQVSDSLSLHHLSLSTQSLHPPPP